MIGIKKCVTISHLPTFKSDDIWSVLKTIDNESTLIAPDYNLYITPTSLRRFSPILRFSYAAAMTIVESAEQPFDAIIVGTGLGCLKDTEKFLQAVINSKGESLSPTAFIQSTHNTIGGAISMGLKNHAYNMTHTQEYFSFEWALLDGMMKIKEGNQNVLLGAADEYIDFLKVLQPKLISDKIPLTSGATFAHLCIESDVYIRDLTFSKGDLILDLERFLTKNEVLLENIDLVLCANEMKEISDAFIYTEFSGNNHCHSAFAFHLAVDAIRNAKKKYVLIINNQHSSKRSFLLLQK